MSSGDLDLVTGAYGNVGGAIGRRLTADGRLVRTLTNHPRSDASVAEALPFSFDDPGRMEAAFAGVSTFYNTYWMRTGDESGYQHALERSLALIRAAERAGVERIVHVSVAHASEASPYPYFRAKAAVEAALHASQVPAAIVRPALIFGGDSVLINNLSWILRRSPVFAVAGDGSYAVRAVHVDDVARICVEAGARYTDETTDAVGPERLPFIDLVTYLRDAVTGRARVVRMPAKLVLAGGAALGFLLRDELLTRDELLSTMDGLADTDGPATGEIALTTWIAEHAEELGRTYVNERRRRAAGRARRSPRRRR